MKMTFVERTEGKIFKTKNFDAQVRISVRGKSKYVLKQGLSE